MKKLVMALMSLMVVISSLNAQEASSQSRHPDQKLEDIKGNVCEVTGYGIPKKRINVLTEDRVEPLYMGMQIWYYTDTLAHFNDFKYQVYVVESNETGEKFLNIEKLITDGYGGRSKMISIGYHQELVGMYDVETGIMILCNGSIN